MIYGVFQEWFITFIDDHTASDFSFIDYNARTCWIYLLKENSDVANTFKKFHYMIRTQFQTQIQVLRTDNGRESSYVVLYIRSYWLRVLKMSPRFLSTVGLFFRVFHLPFVSSPADFFTFDHFSLTFSDQSLSSSS